MISSAGSFAIDAILVACLALSVALIVVGPRRKDDALADFPTYEEDVPVDRYDDPDMDRHIATALAIGHGADAAAIQRSIERSQAAVKGLLASRDELAKRRGAKR